MQQPPKKINAAGGVFAGLIVVFVYGFFVGLPAMWWVLLVAAFVGLWFATARQREEERDTDEPPPDRPWRTDRTDQT